jgi:hypothetical protein
MPSVGFFHSESQRFAFPFWGICIADVMKKEYKYTGPKPLNREPEIEKLIERYGILAIDGYVTDMMKLHYKNWWL